MLFQKKQTGYQAYDPTYKPSSNRTKLIIIVALTALSIVVLILSKLMGGDSVDSNPAKSKKDLAQYTSNSPGLKLSIYGPKDYRLSSNGFEVDIEKATDSPDSITVKKVLPVSGGDGLAKIEKTVARDISGASITGINSNITTAYDKTVLQVNYNNNKNISEYYLIAADYIWQVRLSWSDDNKTIPRYAKEIVASLEVQNRVDNDYLTE
jgi:hypothetical protein